MTKNMIALFLAGGSGTRLWPLSRKNNPKQFHGLVNQKSLMTQTIERMSPLISPQDIWIVTNELYASQIAAHAPGVPESQIIQEPFPLGTNLAVGLGLLNIIRKDPEALIVLGWSDSYVGREDLFRLSLQRAAELAPEVDGVLLAVPAVSAATGYGYIEIGESIPDHEGAFQILRFEEKPSFEKACQFMETKRHFWNPGISVWKASKLLELMEIHKPEHFAALQLAADSLGTADEKKRLAELFNDLDRMPIDQAVFEKAERLTVIPVNFEWNDIGSWSAIYDVRSADSVCLAATPPSTAFPAAVTALAATGGKTMTAAAPPPAEFRQLGDNVTRGKVISLDTSKCLIHAQKRLVATLGVSDLVIVETDDAILIAHKNQTDRLKELYAEVLVRTGEEYL